MPLETLIPLPINWLVSILVLIVAARPDGIPRGARKVFTSWLGVIGLFSGGLIVFTSQPILGTAIFILMFALLAEEHKKNKREYFDNQITKDEVTTKTRWGVEKILDERPKAIFDRMVVTQAPNS
jgi:uncharacterized membrane protein